MKETKEMMIKLPMVTAQTAQELNKARIYPQSGRYIVQLANGDIVIADVELRPIEQGDARSYDEDVASYCTCFVGQPEILDPEDDGDDEWMLGDTVPEVEDLDDMDDCYEHVITRDGIVERDDIYELDQISEEWAEKHKED